MATKTNIANLVFLRLGEKIISDIDTDSSNPASAVKAVWDVILEQTLYEGPEEGWKFARGRYNGVSRESFTITAFAQASSTTTTVTATHALIAGDTVSITDTTSYDGNYDVVSVTSTTSFVITKAFVANDATGTAYWTSEDLQYRYAIPTSTRVTAVTVGGVELDDWVEEGSFILTDQEDTEVDIRYVKDRTNLTVANFPMHFVDILWRRIGIHLTYSFVQNAGIQQQLLTETEQVYLPRSIGMDNRAQYVKEDSTAWVDIGRSTAVIE